MKFSCHRCKTRYSIADERVRGKILKIRCKSCSAIITVKEEGGRAETAPPPTPADAPRAVKAAKSSPSAKSKSAQQTLKGAAGVAPAISSNKFSAAPSTVLGVGDSQRAKAATPAPVAASKSAPTAVAASKSSPLAKAATAESSAKNGSKPALESAFAQAMSTAPGEPSAAAPTSLDSEWYVALDGNQSGPFDLRAARDWVAAQRLDDELYCWTDGFDDWQNIDRVAQFRDLRRPAPGGVVAAPAPAASSGPMSFDDQTVVETGDGKLGSATPAVFGSAGSSSLSNADFSDLPDSSAMDLEIGEVSRVVRLPFLQAPERASSQGALPGVSARVGAGTGAATAMTGSHARIGTTTGGEPVIPDVRNRKRLVPIFLAAGALLVVAGVFLFLAFGGNNDEEAGLRASRIAKDNIAYDFDDPRRGAAKKPGTEPIAPRDTKPERKGTKGGSSSRVRRPNSEQGTTSKRTPTRSGGSDEVDLNGGSQVEELPNELGGEDYERVFRTKNLAITRCHAQAKKRDPSLSVKKAIATVSVAPSGRVSSVKVVGISNDTLKNCLKNSIARFSFPKARKGSNGAATLVFR